MSHPAPLSGLRVVVTRARAQAGDLSRLLREAGASVVEVPTIEVQDPEDWGPADRAIQQLDAYRLVVFTSVNGVERFMGRLVSLGRDTGALREAEVAAIGPATAAALERYRVRVGLVPEEFRAEAVLDAVIQRLGLDTAPGPAVPPRVLIPRALEAREVLPDGLRARGAAVDVVPVYRTVVPEGAAERLRAGLRQGVDLVTFTSPSTVRNFLRLLGEKEGEAQLRGTKVACIGPITAAALRERGIEPHVQPSDYTIEALGRAVVAAGRSGRLSRPDER